MPKKLEKEIARLLVVHHLASANWLGCALGLRSYDRVRSTIYRLLAQGVITEAHLDSEGHQLYGLSDDEKRTRAADAAMKRAQRAS